MTEQEWLACTDPIPMLNLVRGPVSVKTREVYGREVPCEGYFDRKTSDRKLRLFSCACFRRLWHLLDDDHCKRLVEAGQRYGGGENLLQFPLDAARNAVMLSERAADEPISSEELRAASEGPDAFHIPAQDYVACYDPGPDPFDNELVASGHAAYAAYYACDTDPACGSSAVIKEAAYAVAYLRTTDRGDINEQGDIAERAAHCALLRDILGPVPFRPLKVALTWQTSTLTSLAQAIYQERAYDRLPVPATALEDAGCHDAELLAHCRQPGGHVRGCWVVDLLLGKQ